MVYDKPLAEISFFNEVVGSSFWESPIDPDGSGES